jgi:hypothetical protein
VELIQELGAAAGLAGVVGLVVLSALYVSQARDVKGLREWAGAAPERAQRSATPVPRCTGRRIGARPVAVAVALAGLLVLGGVAIYGVSALIGDDGAGGPSHARASRGTASSHQPKRDGAAVTPGDVTVAVLNGTTVSGLAAALRDQLAAAGFAKGMINDFSDQQVAESVIQYAPGHQAEAEAVGRRFGIARHEPVSADSRALAGEATVIVIAGADKAP